MNRCTPSVNIGLLAALLITLPLSALSQSGTRDFPAKALRGTLVVVQPPNVTMDDRATRLSPGARIYNTNNSLVLSASLLNKELVVNYTLDLRDRGLPHTSQAAMCKWYLPKTACEILHQCLILHGHYGYTTDLPHHQRYNDVLGLQIGDGTAQIQKLVIAREKVGRMALQYDKKAKGASK